MRSYRLLPTAKKDLDSIAAYSAKKWGALQAERYLRQLENCFVQIARGEIAGKHLADYENLQSARCQHHYIFFVPGQQVIILRVLHEKMDFTSRLKNYLRDD